MKCPDCGQALAEVTVSGFDKSFRCSNCGGFFMEGWVVNKVMEGKMGEFEPTQADIKKFEGRTDACPSDNSPFMGHGGNNIPDDVRAKKCSHCGWWWFPGDDLLRLKKAYQAKVDYFRIWKKGGELAMMALPVVMTVTMVLGLIGTMFSLTRKPQVGVEATFGVEEFKSQYLGEGKGIVRLKTNKQLEMVNYKKLSDESWGPINIDMGSDGWYQINLTNLEEGEVYQFQIAGKRYYFLAK